MKIKSIGGGPAGLYSAILLKQQDPKHQITVYERNQPNDTFGFGVVFSDATLDGFGREDRPSYDAIQRRMAHWSDIEIFYRGEVVRSTGHGFSGIERQALLSILAERALELGVRVEYRHDIPSLDAVADADLILGADGVNSLVRTARAAAFGPQLDWRPNRFVWLGTTFPFQTFTFYFNENEHGLFRVHAYRYAPGQSTFIVECTEATFSRTGLDEADEQAAVAYCERLFAKELAGHKLLCNRSVWRRFPTIRNASWCDGKLVLLGDAAHTAHFSIGSGTKLAMEDAIALRDAIAGHADVPAALKAYDAARRPAVESLQRAAETSLHWFEETERYFGRLEPLQFAFHLLTRSLRINHDNLRERDPRFMDRLDGWFAKRAEAAAGVATPGAVLNRPTPPMFTPLRLRGLVLPNRVVVSPMCQYVATDGTVDDWHLVHLGSRALGGAGLVIAEMTDVSAAGRITPGCAGLYDKAHVPAWRRIVDFVHGRSPAKIGIQLGHAGRKGSTKRPWEGPPDAPLDQGGWPLLAPSPLPYRPGSPVPRAATRADLDEVRSDFIRATRLALECGFDLIELHFAHGYLLGSFLSPLTNQRQDDYGGTLEKRLRFPLEIFDAVREVWPKERPLSVRLSATDWADGGTTADDAVAIAKALGQRGCDIIDVSTGFTVSDAVPSFGRLFQTPFSDRIRHEAEIATMTVGAISSYSDVNSIIAAGRADLCLLARGHLYDPYWTRHAAFAQGYPLEWPAPYFPAQSFTPR